MVDMSFFSSKKKKLREENEALRFQAAQREQDERYKELARQQEARARDETIRQKEQQWAMERQELQRVQVERLRQEREQQESARIEAEQRAIAEKRRTERLQATTPKALRDLRDLVRMRYQLDMEIWSMKGVRGPDRYLVVEKMERADAVLQEIFDVVQTWEEGARLWQPEEWALAQGIKARILGEGKRWWTNNPPWNET